MPTINWVQEVYDDMINRSSYRVLKGWRWHLYLWFGMFQWTRKVIGGKWERWWVEPCCDLIWQPVTEFTRIGGKRPSPVCKGTPTEEDWTQCPR